MSRISRMERLHRGQEPRLSHISLEHTLQKVCPHGMNAAPFFLPMHTQHTESHPPHSSPLFISASQPSVVSSNSLINDTLDAVPAGLSSRSLLLESSAALSCLSAASAAAKFIPVGGAGDCTTTHGGIGLFWIGLFWMASICGLSGCPFSSSTSTASSSSSSLTLMVVGPSPHVGPQQLNPFNPSRSFRLGLLTARSTPSILSLKISTIVLAPLPSSILACKLNPNISPVCPISKHTLKNQ